MKTIEIGDTNLHLCVDSAQEGRVVITRGGHPVAVVVGVAGLDEEQVALGSSDTFWELIRKRREEKTISRIDLEQQLDGET